MLKVKIKILTVSISIISLLNNTNIVYANKNDLQDKINQNNNLINELKNEKNQILEEIKIETKNLNEINSLIQDRQNIINRIQTKINEIQNKIDNLQNEINNKNTKIKNKEAEIEDKNNRIIKLEDDERQAKEMLDDRLVMYYKSNISLNYLYMLLNSDGMIEFFKNMENVIRVMNTDKKIANKIKEMINETKELKNQLEEDIKIIEIERNTVLENQNAIIESQKIIIEEKKVEQENLAYLSNLETAKSNLLSELNSKDKELEEKITDLSSYNTELQAELDRIVNNTNTNNNNSIGNENEGYLRPVTGYVSSPFGQRVHPITGKIGFHKGVDFANGTGHPIKATKSGRVEYSGWISGYGYTVIINHGNNVQSLYAHANVLNCSVGDYVQQGQKIAEVGSTGNSTGPHLHFEIRINGEPKNPMDYL